MHGFSFRVRYGDTDQMGWAYYATHLRWFEIGRAEMLRFLGRSYRSLEDEDGVRLPVREARCLYRLGARYDDALRVETAVAERSRAMVSFAYRVVREGDSALIALGSTEHVFMNREGRPMPAPREVEELLDRAPLAPPELLAALAKG